MLLKLTKYDLEVRYVPGKKQFISDCLSRAPISDTEPVSEPEEMIGINLIDTLGVDSGTLQKFREASNCDVTSQVVMEYVVKGWPAEKHQLDELAREYWSFREELSVEDGLLFKADRIVVPRSLRPEVLEEIHGAHMGENKSLSFAREYVFWPSMTAQIKDKQVVSTDIFEYGGHSYLLVTDFYSKYFEIELLSQTTASCVINNLKKIFARFGIPAEVLSDNGSQFSNTRNLFNNSHEFKRFADEWGFRHITSSPEYPQSNGAAEKAVQTAKRILKKAAADHKDPFEGLLKYRNTPFDDLGVSPAQLLMSRRTRTQLPTHRRLLLPQPVDPNQVVKTLKHRQSVSRGYYDGHSRDLPPLQVGDKVRIRPNRETEWRKAEVLPRSYLVGDERGRVYRRNRRQIIATPKDQPMSPTPLVTPAIPQPPQVRIKSSTPLDRPTTESPKLSVVPDGGQQAPMTTASGRVIKKPQRLIENI
ncbi:uncharacterized protein K02A2.6 [Exaiptasia diaphana]|uniref:Integrase catalytic domain-containing protein n=1 Tax=Exaiptasia diaphana TaxID=2652724 RepID=A0A913YJ33_EXADI|nr:uncharacterized protein K02A2.6 [Exaiptasia diaphana]